jgi:GT2 family glycosyltransferase
MNNRRGSAASPKFRLAARFLARGNFAACWKEIGGFFGRGIPTEYERWRELHRFTRRERAAMQRKAAAWNHGPKFSIILSPVRKAGSSAGTNRATVHSIEGQIYSRRQLLTVGKDAPSIAEAAKRTDGDFLCFIDGGDLLAEHALLRMAEAIHGEPAVDAVYSDEDSIAGGVHANPFFKPGWSPEYLLAFPYTGRLAVYRRTLVERIGGIREEFAGAFELDLMLRLMAAAARVGHVADILYHRAGAFGPPAAEARLAVEKHLQETNTPGVVEAGKAPGTFRVRYALKSHPLVSIVIPSACRPITFRDRPSWFVLECVASIRKLSTYPNLEIIVLDNNDMSEALAKALDPLQVRRVPFTEPFNLTRKINLGAASARGEQLLLMNDDIEIASADWIESMLEFSQEEDIGLVGVQLLFPDETQQHNGVVLLDGNPRHPFYHAPGAHPGYFHSSQVHRNFAAVTGACTMTRREVFEKVGGYSEMFPLSYNDIDYCLKVLELGKRVVYTPHVKLYHHESVSRPATKPDHVIAFKERWMKKFARDPYYNPNLGRHFRIRV